MTGTLGYARVSAGDQDVAGQAMRLTQLRQAAGLGGVIDVLGGQGGGHDLRMLPQRRQGLQARLGRDFAAAGVGGQHLLALTGVNASCTPYCS